jgi:hypothetical protein
MHIVPDRMRPLDYEVFSVTAVEGYAADGGAPQPFLPFYAANDLSRNPEHRAYYIAARQPPPVLARRASAARARAISGMRRSSRWWTPTRAVPAWMRQLGLDLMCTNRDLPLSMPVGKQHTDFTIAVSAPVASSAASWVPLHRGRAGDGDYAWRFMALNYLSLTDNDNLQGAAALRELLRLYVPNDAAAKSRQLDALLSVSSSPIVRRIPGAGPICAGRGLEVTVTLDSNLCRRRRRRAARCGAGPVLRQIHLHQRVHGDRAAHAGSRRDHAVPIATRSAAAVMNEVASLAPAAMPAKVEDRQPTSRAEALRARLLEEARRFSFFAVMRLLEAVHPEHPRFGQSVRPNQDLLRLGQEPSVVHAPSELAVSRPGATAGPTS